MNKQKYFVGQELYAKHTKFGLHGNEKYIVRDVLGKRKNHNTALLVYYVNGNVELNNKLGKWFRDYKR